jgi:hypothetical protein
MNILKRILNEGRQSRLALPRLQARPLQAGSSIHPQVKITGNPMNPNSILTPLTQSASYTETLSINPVPALPGQFVWLVQTRVTSARNPDEWRKRHQVIVDRDALCSLRDALDRLLNQGAQAGMTSVDASTG